MIALAVLGSAVSWIWTLDDSGDWDLANDVVHVVPALLLVGAGCWRANRERTWTWGLVAVFGMTTAVAQVGWAATGLVSGPGSTPSPFDLVFLIGLPLGLVGFVQHTFRGVPRDQAWRVTSDAAVIALSGLLVWWLTFYRFLELPVPGFDRVIFAVIDGIIAAAVITASLYQTGRRSLWWLTVGLVVATVGDTLSIAQEPGTTPSAALAIGWFLPPLCLAACLLTIDRPGSEYAITIPRRIAVNGGVAIGAVFIAVDAARHGGIDRVTVLFGVPMVLAMVVNHVMSLAEVRRLGTSNVAALAALLESEERFRIVFDGVPIGICVLEEGVIVQVNPSIEALLGIPADDLLGAQIRSLVPEEVVPTLEIGDWRQLAAGESTPVEVAELDLAWTTPLGDHRLLQLTLSRVSGSTTGRTITLVQDVTEARATTDRLADLAVRDALTGLPNRPAFMEHLHLALEKTDSRGVAVAFLDLDRFKVINDSLGHRVGDQLLAIIAERIADAVGGAGLVARFAGDEFTVVMPDMPPGGAEAVMDTVLLTLQRPIELDGGMVSYPTGSIGLAWCAPGSSAEVALAHADAAMYRAKERGRNRVETYDDSGGTSPMTELQVVSELHRAIPDDQLRLHYQPVVDVMTRETLGFEALVRWQHPERGLLPPGEFIELAEESGLIVPIGTWVLREAFRQHAAWAARWPDRMLTMSVNVAARQVSPDLVALVEDALAQTGANPAHVWLEITESTLMTDTRMAQQVLGKLRELGLHITVDDFGTGYSSLTYLQRFPVEGLKVDRSFVSGIGTDDQADAICQALVSLGAALDLHVVAEGVEKEGQLEALQRLACPFAEGYLFGRPQPADAIQARLDVAAATPAPTR